MPNSLTHKYTSDIIFDALDEDLKRKILPYKDMYNFGSMGPDVLMGLMFSKDQTKKDQGDILHEDHIFSSFYRIAEYLRKNHQKDPSTFAYFMGFLTHYATDTVVHPYVYDYIDNRMRQKFDPTLNGCLHLIIETEMDTYVGHYCLHGKHANSYWSFKWGKKQRRQIKRYFVDILGGINGMRWSNADIWKSLFCIRLLLFLCQRHKNGRMRYMILELIDRKLKADHLLLSALRPRGLDTRYDYLNLKKQPYGAIYKDVEQCELEYKSFPEMLDRAKERGVQLIELAYEHIMGGEKLDISEFKLSYNGSYNKEYRKAYGMAMLPNVDEQEESTYDTIY
ncbi:MAG: zinc dependent phospholipase C family protein [Bacillota bacterium]